MKHCALYIHIPFCLKKCAYCDFASYSGKEDQIDDYLTLVQEEMKTAAITFAAPTIDTIYIGGGTPSLLSGGKMAALLESVQRCFSLEPGAEITSEANPGTLTAQKLADYRRAGVNRLSIGVQAFDDRLLSVLGRIHSCLQAEEAVSLARDAGFENISLDLMFGLPGQTPSDWLNTLERAVSLPVRHLSCYSLIVEDGTPMKRLFEQTPQIFPADETVLTMQHDATRFLAAHGFSRYEISNYALPGSECRHNMAYWLRSDYLGVGCAAHSLMDGERFANPDSLAAYFRGERGSSREVLTDQDVYEETVMLGLRTCRGIPARVLKNQSAVNRLLAAGLIRVRDGFVSVTEAGADVLNAIIVELI